MSDLTDEQKLLVRERINTLTAEHFQRIDRLEKDFVKERKRLEDMLRFGCPRKIGA